MGIQQNVNQILGTAVVGAGLAKHGKEQAKANELGKLKAEGELEKTLSDINQEGFDLKEKQDKYEAAELEAGKTAQTQKEYLETLKGVILPDDPEGQAALRKQEMITKKAEIEVEVKKFEKENAMERINERREYLAKQREIALDIAKTYGVGGRR